MKKKNKRKLISAPASWWLKPLPKSKLRGRDELEQRELINQERALLVARAREAILELRQVTHGYDAKDGFSLAPHQLARISNAKYEKLRGDIVTLRDARSRPHVDVVPRSERQRKSVTAVAGQLFKKQKRFILHVPTADNVSAAFEDGVLRVTTKATGVDLYKGYYFFPRKPRSWEDVIAMTKEVMRTGMKEGLYKVYNSIYGEIGEAVSRSKLLQVLEEVYTNYNQYLSGTILGFIWRGTDYKQAERKSIEGQKIREKYRETVRKVRLDREKRIAKRLKRK